MLFCIQLSWFSYKFIYTKEHRFGMSNTFDTKHVEEATTISHSASGVINFKQKLA